jgi:hypothetical protein
LLAVLAGVQHQPGPQFPHRLLGGEPVVQEHPAAAGLGRQLAAQHHVAVVQGEQGLHAGRVRARAHHVPLQALAGEEVQGAQDEALARPGLAGEHVEPRAELQAHVLDQGQVADAQVFQHGGCKLAQAGRICQWAAPCSRRPEIFAAGSRSPARSAFYFFTNGRRVARLAAFFGIR